MTVYELIMNKTGQCLFPTGKRVPMNEGNGMIWKIDVIGNGGGVLIVERYCVERETKCTTAEVNAPDLLTR